VRVDLAVELHLDWRDGPRVRADELVNAVAQAVEVELPLELWITGASNDELSCYRIVGSHVTNGRVGS
jgi:hypothetical protein